VFRKNLLECFGKSVEAAFDGAIENVIADLDAEAAEEVGVGGETDG
jgi:hypothetical protein